MGGSRSVSVTRVAVPHPLVSFSATIPSIQPGGLLADESESSRRDTRRRFEQWARNPVCEANTLSAVHNVPMAEVAKRDGAIPTMGQSPFAIARGLAFERSLYRSGGRAMFLALQEAGVVPGSASGLADFRLRMNGGKLHRLDDALAETAGLLRRVAGKTRKRSNPWLVAGATVRVPGGVMLPEAILVLDALVIDREKTPPRLVVGEIKTYPDRAGYTDAQELATARAQAGIYVHGLRLVVEELGLTGELDVATEGFLVLTRPGFNRPSVRAGEDLRYQAERARRGFSLLHEAADGLPKGSGKAGIDEIRAAGFRYSESCVSFCDRADVCRQMALKLGKGAVLGDDVERFLGAVTLHRTLELMQGAKPATEAERDLQRRIADVESLGDLV